MKKIMFNDRFGLTEAVLAGRKTMTRRPTEILKGMNPDNACDPIMGIDNRGRVYFTFTTRFGQTDVYPHFQIGEEIAIAQSYESIGLSFISPPDTQWGCTEQMRGYRNKLFVRADLMPHRIKITNIKVERLQDISEEDAMREGIYKNPNPPRWREYDPYEAWHPSAKPFKYTVVKDYCKARFAFADLINRVSGSGTWESNPWVFAYEFELIK